MNTVEVPQGNGAWAWLMARLSAYVARLTDERRGLQDGVANGGFALAVIIGREHYIERRKRYPVRGWRDLHRVLRLELASTPPTLALFGPADETGRDVRLFELRPGVEARIGRALWVLPESAVLAATLPSGVVATVERAGHRYFLAASGESQPASGPVSTPRLFALALGLDDAAPTLTLQDHELRPRLLDGLRRLPADAWLRLYRPGVETGGQIAWRPLAIMAGAALVGYLALSSAYLSLTMATRERALDKLGPEVETLLAAQREVAALAVEQRATVRLLRDRAATRELWRLAAAAWEKSANLSQLQLADAKVTIVGAAPSATDVLAAVAAVPGVSDARFAAPVRSERRGEEFTISLTLAPAALQAASGG